MGTTDRGPSVHGNIGGTEACQILSGDVAFRHPDRFHPFDVLVCARGKSGATAVLRLAVSLYA